MNALERAVIEAARAFAHGDKWDLGAAISDYAPATPLVDAVSALDEHEKAMAAGGIREIDWWLVAAGDEVQGKSGTFYPVTGVQEMNTNPTTWLITIRMAQGERTITRPSESQPMATVRRGQDGRAVDVFVDVLSSGGE